MITKTVSQLCGLEISAFSFIYHSSLLLLQFWILSGNQSNILFFYIKVSKRQKQKKIGMSACLSNLKIDWLSFRFNLRNLLVKKHKAFRRQPRASF